MEKVTIDQVDSWMSPADVKRSLTKPLGATDVAVNYYELAPDDSIGFGYHSHGDQEEVFVVQSGTVTFETEGDDVAVSAGEVVRFGPGESQLGTNEGDERAVVLAIGAPQASGELHMVRECASCGERTEQDIQPTESKDALLTLCVDCGAETGRFT